MNKTEALSIIDMLAPVRSIDSTISIETHEQAMACMACGLSGFTPPEHFPQTPGLWDRDCPRCGDRTVWVTEPREKTTT